MEYKLNNFPKVKDSTVKDTISIQDYINLVKNGYDLSNLLNVRKLGKGTTAYKKFKENRLAFTFNCLFDGTRRNNNIIKSTGLLFFDIDDKDFDINTIDKSKFFIIHKSVGGNGYSLFAKVDNIDITNHSTFKSDYLDIAEQLGIKEYIDLCAMKLTQCTVLSYDTDIHVNKDSKVFKSNNVKKGHEGDTNTYKRRERSVCTSVTSMSPFVNNGRLLTKTTLSEYEEDCVYIPEGKEYVEIRLPFNKEGKITKIKVGERDKWLSIIINNLIYINKTTDRVKVFNFVNAINNNYVEVPFTTDRLYSIIDYKISRLEEGTLSPVGAKLKKFWIDPKVKDKKDKFHEKRKSISTDKIEEFLGDELLSIEEKVTYKMIADYCGISERTVKRKFNENDIYKQVLESHNEGFDSCVVRDYLFNEMPSETLKITQKVIAERCNISLRTVKRKFKENKTYKDIVKSHNLKIKNK